VAGRYPLLTDEDIEGPIVRGLRNLGWDVEHAFETFGEKTLDLRLFEYAASTGRVFVTTDVGHLRTAREWIDAGKASGFRMVWWPQRKTQELRASVVLQAFERLATKEGAFAYPIEFLEIRD